MNCTKAYHNTLSPADVVEVSMAAVCCVTSASAVADLSIVATLDSDHGLL